MCIIFLKIIINKKFSNGSGSLYFISLVQSWVTDSVGSRHLLKGQKSYLNLMQIQLGSKGVNDPFLVPGQCFGAQLIILGLGKASNVAPCNGYFFKALHFVQADVSLIIKIFVVSLMHLEIIFENKFINNFLYRVSQVHSWVKESRRSRNLLKGFTPQKEFHLNPNKIQIGKCKCNWYYLMARPSR